MKIRNVFLSLLAVALIWACGKDDDPAPPKNNAPVIAAKTFAVAENIAPGTAIGTVTATDADKDALTFSITTNDSDLFAITKAGVLSLASGKTLSFATKAQHVITVAVSDGEASASAKVTINVTKLDPENQAPIVEPQEFSVMESIADTEVIGTIMAIDPEEGALVFAIAVNDNDLFEIDPVTGELSLAEGKQLDFGAAQEHVITVAVSDGNSATTAAVTITVTQDPLPTGEPQSFNVEESIADTEVIGTVVAEDPEGQALTFSIKTNDNELFEITEGGELSLAAGKALDYVAQKQHDIVVSVTDGYNSVDLNVSIKVLEALADDPTAFVTTWKTETDGEKITIGLNSDYNYDFTISWGDGTVENLIPDDNANTIDHVFASAGTYTVAIIGDFPAIKNSLIFVSKENLMSIEQWGAIKWQTMYTAFSGCENMVYNATDVPDLTNVTNLGYMFSNTLAFNEDVSNWDVSNVTNMEGMFFNAKAFNQDLGGWNVSNVTNMTSMFEGATSFNQDLSGWSDKLGNVTNMSGMFAYTDAFNGAIGNWNVSSVTNMSQMFWGAKAFNQDISNWAVGNVTDMSRMFREATAFNQALSGWADKLGNVTDMSFMFLGATAFNQSIFAWNVSNVTNMTSMFEGATSFNLNLGNWDVSSVTNMSNMFKGANSFNQDLSGWNNKLSKVTNMSGMFWGATAYNQDISGWVLGNVTNMSNMFREASSFNQNLGSWNVGSVTKMTGMFWGATAFDQNLNNWVVGNVTDMSYMFYDATVFDQSLASWNIENVTDMTGMLNNCGMSAKNYSYTLISWAAQNVQNNVTFGNEGLNYCTNGSEAETARFSLVQDHGWSFSPNGQILCFGF